MVFEEIAVFQSSHVSMDPALPHSMEAKFFPHASHMKRFYSVNGKTTPGDLFCSLRKQVFKHAERDDIYFERVDHSVSMRIEDYQSPINRQAAQVW